MSSSDSSGARETPSAIGMRDLGKLTVSQLSGLDHPLPVTSSGEPVAWLVPLSDTERVRARLIAEGRLEPRRRDDLEAWRPGPAVSADESLVSDLLLEMRESERT